MKIAARINALLVREMGQGIDPARMLTEPLYARDVLLVCEALPGTELAELAPKFRQALAAAEADHEARDGQPSGFSPSRFLNSLFGHSTGSPNHTLDSLGRPETAQRRDAQDSTSKPTRSWFGRLGK
jgi:hypothetical protein